MPDMTGDEMLKQLRESEWGKFVKVIILTNKSEQEATDAVRNLGTDAIIVKANMTPRQVAELVKQKLSQQPSVNQQK
jgi:DNA-binding NarL/FixJ family response regulator